VKRVAALYDIHGNVDALEAALKAAVDTQPDTILFGGDLALGPFPREVMDVVMSLGGDTRFIRGNCDRLVVDAYDGRDLAQLPAQVRDAIEWTARQLDARHRDFLDSMSPTATLDVDGMGDVLFCHATPRSDDEIITVRTPADRVQSMVDGVTARTIVCGHTHMQFDRTVNTTRIVNAGSVGMPSGSPGAHWLLLGSDVTHVRTFYDLEHAADKVRRSAYPTADDFAEHSVLRPGSENEMLVRLDPCAP
jgi:Predicted phosphoesterases, related to the Icc protein